MAELTQVKKYLAYWFQLGQKIIIPRTNKSLIPKKVLNDSGYSSELEKLWALVTNDCNRQYCYLEGTNESIGELLSPEWDIIDCARCNMPMPIVELGIQSASCVCDDLDNWPNNELPNPRSSVNNTERLMIIRKSLLNKQKNNS